MESPASQWKQSFLPCLRPDQSHIFSLAKPSIPLLCFVIDSHRKLWAREVDAFRLFEQCIHDGLQVKKIPTSISPIGGQACTHMAGMCVYWLIHYVLLLPQFLHCFPILLRSSLYNVNIHIPVK